MMYEKPLVSVIVPAYNVEKYIKKCISSLINQDYSNLEFIIVNDGSTDNTLQICESLHSKRDLKILSQNNKGVSAARNAGLKNAHGEYIFFVDGDDWVESNYVSYFLNTLKVSGCDTCFNKSNYCLDKKVPMEERGIMIVKNSEAMRLLYSEEVFVAVWNKIYSNKVIVERQLQFDEKIWYGEGMLFNINYLQYVKEIAISNCAVYHQRFNIDSAMRKFDMESQKCGLLSLDIQRSIWESNYPEVKYDWQFHKYRFNKSIINGIVRVAKEEQYKEELKQSIHNLRKGWWIPLFANITFREKVYWMMYIINPLFMGKRASNVFTNNCIKQMKQIGGYRYKDLVSYIHSNAIGVAA